MTDAELDEVLNEMRTRGVGIIDAIKFVRSEKGVTLGEAKLLVSQHPAYAEVHAANEPLRQEVFEYVDAGVFDDPPKAWSGIVRATYPSGRVGEADLGTLTRVGQMLGDGYMVVRYEVETESANLRA